MPAVEKIIAFAQEQIAYGRNLSEAMAARDGLRRGRSDPDGRSLRWINAKIGRMLTADAAPTAPVRSGFGPAAHE